MYIINHPYRQGNGGIYIVHIAYMPVSLAEMHVFGFFF